MLLLYINFCYCKCNTFHQNLWFHSYPNFPTCTPPYLFFFQIRRAFPRHEISNRSCTIDSRCSSTCAASRFPLMERISLPVVLYTEQDGYVKSSKIFSWFFDKFRGQIYNWNEIYNPWIYLNLRVNENLRN